MGIKKFIESAKESLGLDEFKISSKKKSLKSLLKKLHVKKEKIEKSLEEELKKKEKKELKEELDIISLQIKKGNKMLDKLNAKSAKDKPIA